MISFVRVPDLPVLLPGVPVLPRADRAVHVGHDPGTAVILDVPRGVSVSAVVDLLRRLRRRRTYRSLCRDVRGAGLDAAVFRDMVDRIVDAGMAVAPDAPPRVPIRVHVVGGDETGPALASSLRAAGHVVDADPYGGGLVVIADQPVPDPRLTVRLMATGTPHLPVHLRDGVGVIGPLVLPGTSSCLRCADLYRTDLDPQWPLVAARLIDVAGYAERAVLATTAALAHAQIDEITARLVGRTPGTPSLVGRSLEFRTSPTRLDSHVAPVHPRCGCQADELAQV